MSREGFNRCPKNLKTVFTSYETVNKKRSHRPDIFILSVQISNHLHNQSRILLYIIIIKLIVKANPDDYCENKKIKNANFFCSIFLY